MLELWKEIGYMHPYLIIRGGNFLNYRKELRLYNHKQYDICKSRPRNKLRNAQPRERFNSATKRIVYLAPCISRDTINIHLNRSSGYDLLF